jgi:DNA primase catalytic subunit
VSCPSRLKACLRLGSQERQEAARWEQGAKTGKGSKQEKEEKRKADLVRKAEKARLLAEEEASIASESKVVKKAAAKATKPAGPGASVAGDSSLRDGEPESLDEESPVTVESFAATGIDDALELLEFVTGKADKASVGQLAAGLERHPEVCPSLSCIRVPATNCLSIS